jgi:hypothetical protein
MATISPVDLQKALKGANYPSDRDALVGCAKSNGAEASLVNKLEHLDRDRFDGPNDVEKAVFRGGGKD